MAKYNAHVYYTDLECYHNRLNTPITDFFLLFLIFTKLSVEVFEVEHRGLGLQVQIRI